MTARLLKGNEIQEVINAELADEIALLRAQGVRPGLAAVLVGENPASQIYVRSKVKACESLGLYSERIDLPVSISTAELIQQIHSLNSRDEIDGILVQLPLPKGVDTHKALDAVDPAKDVDGFHPINAGRLMSGRPGLAPCTPVGIMEILHRSHIPVEGSRAVVIGRSDIVGKPVALLLLRENATVTVCHSRTSNLAEVTRQADILVAAMGRPAFVTREFIKPGATVIDVGTNRLSRREEVEAIFGSCSEALSKFERKGTLLVGDVHPQEVREVAGAYTPVPGGVGPLTIAMLMSNTLKAARQRRASSLRG
ncbi:MAG TPA: bifunctional methylenetetrahydrofolate dehydrogenase/methenyltetrahydrofolate cyclohydrolase FolD [Terriglobia bacterium]|nr:bifunctional methylenetetrahydrofolate dehydrogenase/methenyltetrahydrofolate cyclohydrolase FolD [Terriglobia bacterium]